MSYHGTSLSHAKRLLAKKFYKTGDPKLHNSIGYALNATNNRQEAENHARSAKRFDKSQTGTIVELDIDENATILTKEFENSDNNYRYQLYQEKKPDLIRIKLAPGFDIDVIANPQTIRSVKIVEII